MNTNEEYRLNKFVYDLTGINLDTTTKLTKREHDVVIMCYGTDKSLKEIGAEFGVTSERIRQINAKAMRKLRMAVRRTIISESFPKPEKDEPPKVLFSTCNPSARLFNSIARDLIIRKATVLIASEVTLDDIVCSYENVDDLMKARCFGQKAFEELIGIIHGAGLKFHWE